jgi:hypothetical protein
MPPPRHALIVDPLDGGRSRFTTHDDVSGLLLLFTGKVMAASQRGFELMARALKERGGLCPPQTRRPPVIVRACRSCLSGSSPPGSNGSGARAGWRWAS